MKSPLPKHASGEEFYCGILDVINAGAVECLVGGAFAMRVHAGIDRDTKDFDLMLRPRDVERVLDLCRTSGFHAAFAFPHWIAKVHFGEHFIDLIFRAGNGLCEVDDTWFAPAQEAEVLGHTLRVCPAEEMIWQKAFVMERERFDGADIMHLLRSTAQTLDWPRLVSRFGEDWRVLLSHLVLFGFVYPQQRHQIPPEIMDDLLTRLRDENSPTSDFADLCRGTLLSRAQYLPDIERWGYRDARLDPRVRMTREELVTWTNAIDRSIRSR